MSYTRLYQMMFGSRLPQGPFQGMHYIRACVGSAMWPKLLGSYEKELVPAIEELVRWKPDAIINAGAAEGYYAVGMARRCAAARISAYEMTAEGRKLLTLLATKNGVSGRVQVAGELTPSLLQNDLASASRPAVILDVEGAEMELLDLQRCSDLARAFILLENHDLPAGSTLPEMVRRFTRTHELEIIPAKQRDISDLPPALRWLARCGFQGRVLALLDEGRWPAPPWLRLRPKS